MMNPKTIIKIITVVGAFLTGLGEILRDLNEKHQIGLEKTATEMEVKSDKSND